MSDSPADAEGAAIGESSSGALVARVYRSLTRDTLLPSDPLVVGQAALDAIIELRSLQPCDASGSTQVSAAEVPSPPDVAPTDPRTDARPLDGFGDDVDRDAAWLAGLLPAGTAPWPVLQRMADAADKPHTNVVLASAMEGIGALQQGAARTTPGLGMWLQDGGSLVVARVDPGGSAEACGLRRGDLVRTLGGEPPRPSGLHQIKLFSAEEGSRMELLMERDGIRRSVWLTFRLGSVVSLSERLLQGPVGYVEIPWFATTDDPARDTGALVRAALTRFIDAGARGLVVDLRSGMGGSGRAVRDILSAVTTAETVVALSELGGKPETYDRTGERIWPDLPVAVLINEQTTSAAEMLGVGLQELAGATLLGAPTSGGLNTLRVEPLADGYVLVLPDGIMLGPASLAPRPGYRLEPDIPLGNPTAVDIAAGRDAQLEAARRWLLTR